ncbi:MAG: glycosyltransferase family 2 protein [Gammaproteobacteria bacterium]|nr:glycosyltransferase family 2 protein [Gammaproteobacteria bacterium]NNF60193.1 glycosyltransferase family 2 protein [Gammaproteobacteria bacterium]NNM21606.1 glycosyltransferase family 2 protein [Gammaproteobacteria bacterium]
MLSLAIVVPCFNEEAVLPSTMEQLLAVLEQIQSDDNEISGKLYFVDDGSRDRTWELVSTAAARDKRICGVRLSRNHGHQRALLAGLLSVDADIVISIDADLQDDLDVIGRMVAAYREGNDVVYGVRSERDSDSFAKRVSAVAYYRLLKLMGIEVVHNHADFRLLSRRALNTLREYREVNLFLRGVIPTIGFPSTQIQYRRKTRDAGRSKYTMRRMLSLAVHGVTSFSALPLRMIALLGIVVSFGTLLLSGWVLWTRLTNDAAVPGWASSVLPIYLLGGIQLLGIGVVGEYVGKIYLETKRRPRFIIQATVGEGIRYDRRHADRYSHS